MKSKPTWTLDETPSTQTKKKLNTYLSRHPQCRPYSLSRRAKHMITLDMLDGCTRSSEIPSTSPSISIGNTLGYPEWLHLQL